ncbi:DNA replication/repair protein RecF [Rhodophyticola sp. CCM32]|uniref:DNA replication/repair protein RecF n=1 Tax=Rhodophyticola sp. CCM32 TaxID=2916397 RepID=UPI00107F6E39|nr:DNA replication/repair protein RecF [Rhodophyticola sp. CCM32]QBY01910.1 DNA replication/repair protein RecF [Rhodophyticola sp. CCM32]
MKVFLTHLHLSHFRSHKRADLALDGRPLALYGPNGAGKTNILEAVSLLSPGRGLRRATGDDIARKPESLGWKISAGIAGDLTHELTTGAETGQPRTLQIDGKTAPQTALARILPMVWLVPAQDRLWIEGADGRRRFFDRMTMSFTPAHAEAVLAYDKAMRERNRLLKDMVRDAHWYDAIEVQMSDAAAKITGNRHAALSRISSAQQGAQTAFPTADLTLREAEGGEALRAAGDFAAAFAASRPRDLAAGRSLIGPHRSDIAGIYAAKGAPAAQCSTGEQKALLISLILANARALREDTGTAPLVLLDEVAAHLDASRRAALFDEICALDTQAWLTGTGADLFTDLGDRAQHISVTERSGVSAIHFS